MNRSFYNGVSGSLTYQYGMTTIANNIGNIDTPAFKGRDTEFANLFSQILSESGTLPTANQIGLGSRVQATPLDISVGVMKDSDREFDTAIKGDGWYAIGVPDGTLYTRAGDFYFNADRYLVTNQGGYPLGVSGNVFTPDPENEGRYIAAMKDAIELTPNTPVEKLFLPDQVTLPAEPTRNISLAGNLDPTPEERIVTSEQTPDSYQVQIDEQAQTATIEGTAVATDEIAEPQEGDKVVVTLTNADGVEISLTTALDQDLNWKIEAADIARLDPANKGPITAKVELNNTQVVPPEAHFRVATTTGSGEKGMLKLDITPLAERPEKGSEWKIKAKTLEFFERYDPDKQYDETKYYIDEATNSVYAILDSQEGKLTFNENGALTGNTLPTLDNGGTEITVEMGSFYDPDTPNSGYDGFTSIAGIPTGLTKNESDGHEESEFSRYTIAPDGTIFAEFKNGEMTAAARLPIYHFINDQGLSTEGGVYFSTTVNSGKPYLMVDKNGKVVQNDKVIKNAIEGSNVDAHKAMTELIIMQKAFDANAKSITTSDQMIQRAINMKK